MSPRSVALSLVSWALFSMVGCGDPGQGAAARKPTHKVSGTITMGDSPVVNATVTFSPKQGQPPALGKTDSSGKYTLTTYDAGDGAVEGDYVVTVSKSGGSGSTGPTPEEIHQAVSSGQPPPTSHSGPRQGGSSSDSLLPEKYRMANTSTLTATVVAREENVFDFSLD
jgi:hypothetical protein